ASGRAQRGNPGGAWASRAQGIVRLAHDPEKLPDFSDKIMRKPKGRLDADRFNLKRSGSSEVTGALRQGAQRQLVALQYNGFNSVGTAYRPHKPGQSGNKNLEEISMNRRHFLASAAAGSMGLALPGIVRAQQPIIIKFSHVVSPDAPKGKASVYFKELAEKYT